MRILITELIWDIGIQTLTDAGFEVDYDPSLGENRTQLLSVIDNYDGLIVRNKTIVDELLMTSGSKLKVIGRLGVGVDNINLESAKYNNIQVIIAKNANATSVSEYVMAALLDASRNLNDANEDVRGGNWQRKLFTGGELAGKTLGLIGMGEISHRVAKRADSFQMNVIGYDPFINIYDFITQETGVKICNTLESLYSQSDFISLHVPLTDDTRRMINKSTFQQMKKNAYIINSSRGGIVDEKDLCTSIQDGEIRGAYLDVLEEEPLSDSSPLHHTPEVTLTPHIAGLTEESQLRTSKLVAERMVNVLNDL
ncbi:hydroxyacid dehydrogenase [Salinicoccus albus]|uniref:hydroxyacid dehydrogenase n=1 Tax=Salinicoccus albus TaxID=418756 RepID=UPI000374FCA7|nr:hydroxyacid dehydrogenase [Salinicoccus albus]